MGLRAEIREQMLENQLRQKDEEIKALEKALLKLIEAVNEKQTD